MENQLADQSPGQSVPIAPNIVVRNLEILKIKEQFIFSFVMRIYIYTLLYKRK